MNESRRQILLDTPHTETATGAIASFETDMVGRAKEVKVEIEPVQDLHGYDNPWPAGGGKNKLNLATDVVVLSGTVPSAVTITSADGTATITENYYNRNSNKFGWAFNVEENTNYTISGNAQSSSKVLLKIYSEDGSLVYSDAVTQEALGAFNRTFNSGSNTKLYFYASISSWGQTIALTSMQIESGSTATDYAPYSNICPISGRTGANVWDDPKHGGLIEWNQHVENGDFSDGTTRWAQGSGSIIASNKKLMYTATNKSAYQYINQDGKPYIYGHKVLISFAITLSEANTVGVGDGSSIPKTYSLSANSRMQINDIWTLTNANKNSFILYIYPGRNNGLNVGATATIENVMFFDLTAMFGAGNEPSTAEEFKALSPHDYYPYNTGETTCVSAVNGDEYMHIPISWADEAGTVYGGTLEWEKDGTVKLTKTMASVDLGTLTWAKVVSGANRFQTDLPTAKAVNNGSIANAICEAFPTQSAAYTYGNNGYIAISDASLIWISATDLYSDAAAFKIAMSGVQLVYELATPQTYTLTPQGALVFLRGTNHVWNDINDTTVTYWTHKTGDSV